VKGPKRPKNKRGRRRRGQVPGMVYVSRHLRDMEGGREKKITRKAEKNWAGPPSGYSVSLFGKGSISIRTVQQSP